MAIPRHCSVRPFWQFDKFEKPVVVQGVIEPLPVCIHEIGMVNVSIAHGI